MRRTRSSYLLVSALVVSACAPLFGNSNFTSVRPVETPVAAAAHPDDGFYQDAVKALDNRDYALALDALQAARALEPNDVRVLNALGVVYDKLGRFDLSSRYYKEASLLDPASPVVAQNLVYSAMLRRLAGTNPNLAEAEARPVSAEHSQETSEAINYLKSQERVPPQQPGETGASPVAAQERLIAAVAQSYAAPAPAQAAPRDIAPRSSVATIDGRGSDRAPAPSVVAAKTSQSVAAYAPNDPVSGPAPAPAAQDDVAIAGRRPWRHAALLAGHPFSVIDASGDRQVGEQVRGALVGLGWPAPALSKASAEAQSTLFFPLRDMAAAKDLEATLGFHLIFAVRACDCGLTLVLGQNAPAALALDNPSRPKRQRHVSEKA